VNHERSVQGEECDEPQTGECYLPVGHARTRGGNVVVTNSRAMRDGVLPKVLKLGDLVNQAGVIKQHESVLVFSSGSILRNIVSPAIAG
jgi:hypothetical protein